MGRGSRRVLALLDTGDWGQHSRVSPDGTLLASGRGPDDQAVGRDGRGATPRRAWMGVPLSRVHRPTGRLSPRVRSQTTKLSWDWQGRERTTLAGHGDGSARYVLALMGPSRLLGVRTRTTRHAGWRREGTPTTLLEHQGMGHRSHSLACWDFLASGSGGRTWSESWRDIAGGERNCDPRQALRLIWWVDVLARRDTSHTSRFQTGGDPSQAGIASDGGRAHPRWA